MGFFKSIAKAAKKSVKGIESTAKDVGSAVADAAEDAGDFVVGIGKDAGHAISSGAQEALRAVESAGEAVGAFSTRPLATFDLPDGAGKVRIWIGVYQIHLAKETIDDISSGGDIAVSVAALAGTIVSASGGTLAPVVVILAAYLTLEWILITRLANEHGVNIRGMYAPPSGVFVPTPGDK